MTAESVKLDQAVAAAVQADHQARTVEAQVYEVVEGRETVLLRTDRIVVYWDQDRVRSALEADYAAEQARMAGEEADREAQRQLKQAVLTVAQSAVGVRFDQLTAAQLRALFAIMLFREGALDNAGLVRPLGQWVR